LGLVGGTESLMVCLAVLTPIMTVKDSENC